MEEAILIIPLFEYGAPVQLATNPDIVGIVVAIKVKGVHDTFKNHVLEYEVMWHDAQRTSHSFLELTLLEDSSNKFGLVKKIKGFLGGNK